MDPRDDVTRGDDQASRSENTRYVVESRRVEWEEETVNVYRDFGDCDCVAVEWGKMHDAFW